MQKKWKAAVLLGGIAVQACTPAARPSSGPAPSPAGHEAHGQTGSMTGMPGMAGDTVHRPRADTMRGMAGDSSAAMNGMHESGAPKADTASSSMPGMPGMRMGSSPSTAPASSDERAGGRAEQTMRHGAMPMVGLGGGWTLMGMAQGFPIVTVGAPGESDSPLHRNGFYVTQPAVMANVASPGSRLVLRTTLNFEPLTQRGGELTFGGWGEGFIDKRHPHTLLHELMLSANLWRAGPGSFSLSAGKGFAPFGTDDPMSRPAVKYPTNHHLSQILERWTVNGAYRLPRWTLEAGVFGGQEPKGPYDLGNWRSFGDSWSARVTRSFGDETMGTAPWELSASYGSVREEHAGAHERDRLVNGAVRHQQAHAFGSLYALAEASWRGPADGGPGWWAVLGEAELDRGRHQPYYRVEYATRPEYARDAGDGNGFFRYDEDSEPIGATRWLINTFGYRYDVRRGSFAAAPFVEAAHNRVSPERGGVDPRALFGARSFWSLSAGFRVFLGGGPMRMGSYGVRDDMTSMQRGMGAMAMDRAMKMHATPDHDGHGQHR